MTLRHPDPDALDPRVRDMLRAVVLAEVADARPSGARRARVRRLSTMGLLGLALVAGVGMTAAVRTYQRYVAAPPAMSVRCYESVSRDAGDDFPGTSVMQAAALTDPSDLTTSSIVDIADPVPICADLWRSGVLPMATVEDRYSPTAEYPVPDLTACVWRNGAVSVYPGRPGVCADIDLSEDSNSRPYLAGEPAR